MSRRLPGATLSFESPDLANLHDSAIPTPLRFDVRRPSHTDHHTPLPHLNKRSLPEIDSRGLDRPETLVHGTFSWQIKLVGDAKKSKVVRERRAQSAIVCEMQGCRPALGDKRKRSTTGSIRGQFPSALGLRTRARHAITSGVIVDLAANPCHGRRKANSCVLTGRGR